MCMLLTWNPLWTDLVQIIGRILEPRSRRRQENVDVCQDWDNEGEYMHNLHSRYYRPRQNINSNVISCVNIWRLLPDSECQLTGAHCLFVWFSTFCSSVPVPCQYINFEVFAAILRVVAYVQINKVNNLGASKLRVCACMLDMSFSPILTWFVRLWIKHNSKYLKTRHALHLYMMQKTCSKLSRPPWPLH